MDDDYVWLHDYHLLVLPSLLRKRFNRIRLGLFLHSPFPSSEIFRTFPRREEILRSLLNADLVGEPYTWHPGCVCPVVSCAELFLCDAGRLLAAGCVSTFAGVPNAQSSKLGAL